MVGKSPKGMIIMERVELWGPEGMSQQLEALPLFQRTHITTIPDDLRISLTSTNTRHTHDTQTYKHKALVQFSASGVEKWNI